MVQNIDIKKNISNEFISLFLLCSRQLTNSELPTNASKGEMVIEDAASKYVYDYTRY